MSNNQPTAIQMYEESRREAEQHRDAQRKYVISRADGSPIELGAKYFVLRYDANSEDFINTQLVLKEYSRLLNDRALYEWLMDELTSERWKWNKMRAERDLEQEPK